MTNNHKSSTSYDNYLKKKQKIEKQSYAKRNKWKREIGYFSSWIFNIISFLLTFIFLKSIIDVSFSELANSNILYYITMSLLGTVLMCYELVKRFNVDHFCADYYEHDNKYSVSFIKYSIITLIIVIPSIIGSINGSVKIVDNYNVVEKKIENNLLIKTDSISRFYFTNYIQPLQNENITLQNQKNDYILKNKTYLVKTNDNLITTNKEKISSYEKERDDKIKLLEDKNVKILNTKKSETNKNVWVFIIISFFIEVVILVGVWYKRKYDMTIVKDFEEIDMNSPNFKKWLKFTEILQFIYSSSNSKVGGDIETTQNLTSLIENSNINISKKDLDDCFKLMNFLNIYEKEGRRRVIRMDFDKAALTLKKHFKIE